jgi:hypothetical protein
MRGYPEFNFPAFHAAAAQLRALGHEVFSPAEKDIEREGVDISKGNATGNEAQLDAERGLKPGGFLRVALRDDLTWICTEADGIACLQGWAHSKGAQAELATARALGLPAVFQQHNGEFV